jgi:hypothetical protein
MHLLAIAANIASDGAIIALKMGYLKSGVKTLLVRFTSLVSLLTSLFANNENTPAP